MFRVLKMNTLPTRLTEIMAELGLEKPKDLADFCGVSEGLVSQWFSGRTKLGPKPLRAFSRTHFNLDWVTDGRLPKYRTDHSIRPSGIRALHPEDPLPDDVVAVPESRIEFSAGPGRQAVFELVEDTEPANYRLSWFQKERINPDSVRRFRVTGDSLEDFLHHGDTVLVNLDETSVVDGKLYAIRYENDLRIKFLYRKLDGTLILRSKNSAYPDEEVPPELVNEHISIIGRVRDKSGKGGL